jgi:hypothetical protein
MAEKKSIHLLKLSSVFSATLLQQTLKQSPLLLKLALSQVNNVPSHQVDFFYLNEQAKTLSPKRSRAEINPHSLNEMDGQD